MAAETVHDIIKVCRSDGQDNGPDYWPVEAPKVVRRATKDGPEKVARAKPQMIRLPEDDPRFIEWRLKLGILLKQEMAPMAPYPNEGNPWYVEFPRGYWLYERSKHLWVSGHPMKTSLFKSPQEFGVHILWLFSSSDDRADCCCVHCSMVPTGRTTPSVYDTPSLPGGPQSASQPALAPISSAPIPQATTVPAPIPGLGQSLLYRTGELVWFTNGPSWRLGLIAQSANGMHQVVPLGHSYFRQPLVGKNDGQLRPFQAFTVPPVTIPAFRGNTYDAVGWETVLKNLSPEQAKVHRDSVLLDASKLAAQKIDMCYSLFGKLGQKGSDSSYQGVFLGAERIEVGDTLRVIPPPWLTTEGTVYFGLYEIKSKQSGDPPGRAVSFGGMFYELLEGEKAKTTSLPDNALPRALREESIWRKSVAPTQPLSWSSPGGSTSLEESQIKGRFYPTFLLAPILDPKKFASVTAKDDKGRLTPAQVTPALNGRLPMAGDADNAGWRLNRMVAAGASIPHDAVFWFEPQVREEVEAL